MELIAQRVSPWILWLGAWHQAYSYGTGSVAESLSQWHHLQQISPPSPSQIVSPNIHPVCERESILLQIIRSNKYVFKKLSLHRNMTKFSNVIYTYKLLYIWLHLWPTALLPIGQKHFNLNLHDIFDWKNIWFIKNMSKNHFI